MLSTLEIRARGRAVLCRGFGALAAGLGGVIAGGLITYWVLSCLASAFTAVAAVTVTRAAFAAFIVFSCAGTFGWGVGVCRLVCTQGRFSRTGIVGICRAALRAFATFTPAFAPAFATFAAAFTSLAWGALRTHFTAFGIQLGLCIVAGFAQAVGALAFGQVFATGSCTAITAALSGWTITV